MSCHYTFFQGNVLINHICVRADSLERMRNMQNKLILLLVAGNIFFPVELDDAATIKTLELKWNSLIISFLVYNVFIDLELNLVFFRKDFNQIGNSSFAAVEPILLICNEILQ